MPLLSDIFDTVVSPGSASWSNTIRTARSRTSGAYLPGLPMNPSSQGMRPPVNPDRSGSQSACYATDQGVRCGERVAYAARICRPFLHSMVMGVCPTCRHDSSRAKAPSRDVVRHCLT